VREKIRQRKLGTVWLRFTFRHFYPDCHGLTCAAYDHFYLLTASIILNCPKEVKYYFEFSTDIFVSRNRHAHFLFHGSPKLNRFQFQ
jgi:hypothetical protein